MKKEPSCSFRVGNHETWNRIFSAERCFDILPRAFYWESVWNFLLLMYCCLVKIRENETALSVDVHNYKKTSDGNYLNLNNSRFQFGAQNIITKCMLFKLWICFIRLTKIITVPSDSRDYWLFAIRNSCKCFFCVLISVELFLFFAAYVICKKNYSFSRVVFFSPKLPTVFIQK